MKNIGKNQLRRTKMYKHISHSYLYIHPVLTISLAVICFVLFAGVGVANGAGVIPDMELIQTYSSIGGNPQYKGNEQDLIYKMNQADEITFSITAAQPNLNYSWQAMKGNEVLESSTEGNTFTWTVPSEQCTWQIEIELTFKDDIGNTTGRDYLSWSITTSDLITVQPGESIQDAIDNLPVEGGIIELAAGTHDVYDTITIDRSNVIIQGTHDSIVRHHNKDVYCFSVSSVSAVTFRGFTTASSYTLSDGAQSRIIVGSNVNNFMVENMHDTSWARYFADANGENVYYENNIMEHCGVHASYVDNMYIANNTILGARVNYALHTDSHITNLHIIGNRVINAGANSGLLIDGAKTCIMRDNFVQGSQWSLRITQSVLNAIVENNTFTGARDEGIILLPQNPMSGVVIRNNRIYNNGKGGIWSHHYSYPSGLGDVTVVNNVIYNNGGDGIKLSCDTTALNITNNIITNNGGYGINNILTGEGTVHAYNDLWGNTLGNYNNIAEGTGEIHENPLFADPATGDFHIKSQYGRWTPSGWVTDSEHSPCIDAGDPSSDYSNEPGYPSERINMGVYGNTEEASMGTSTGPDITLPYTSDHSPAKNATGISRDTNIVVHIKDDGDGVNQSLIVMTVEGETISPTITGTANDYTLTYNPPTPFNYSQVVDITLDAQDLASPPNIMSQDNYSFTIEEEPSSSSFFSNINVTAIRDTSVVIRWDTDTAATGQIEYGLDTNYGNLTEIEGISYWHPIEITGLTPGTTYHYRIRAKDYKGVETLSGDYTFTTRTTLELENLIKAVRNDGELPKTYYVKQDGNNGNNGLSLENAWATPSYAASQADAGDIIYVLDGSYSGGVKFITDGIPEASITMKAYDGTPDITGQIDWDADYTILDGFVCHDAGGFVIDVRYRTGIKILNCEVYNSGSDCIYFRDVTYSIIENTTVHNSGWNGFGLKPTSFFPFSVHHIILRNCETYDIMQHNAFDIQGEYTTLENCHANRSSLAPMRITGDHVVVNNFTGENGNNGIHLVGSFRNSAIMNSTLSDKPILRSSGVVGNTIIYNNNINYTNYGIFIEADTNVTIEDNQIYTQETSGYTYGIKGTGDVTIRNEKISPYRARSVDGATITVEYTDGRTFSVDGSSEYTTYAFSSGTRKIEVIGSVSVGNIPGTVTDAETSSGIEGATVSGGTHSAVTASDGTYTISGVPIGTYTVICTATGYEDGSQPDVTVTESETTTVDFQLAAASLPNNPPVLASIGDKSIDENQQLTFTLTSTDPDGDSLTYSATNLPTGAVFTGNGDNTAIFSWTLDYEDSGTYSNIHFKVSDGTDTDSETITITVSNVNRVPTAPTVAITPTNPTTNNDLICSIITLSTDPDGDAITYTYTWYKDNIEQTGLTTDTVSSSYTSSAETWKCILTPNDGTVEGDSGEDSITISATTTTIPLDIGWNLIALSLEPHTPYTAESLCSKINSQGNNVVEIDRWHNGTWEGYILGLPFNNFDIELRSGYRIKCLSAGNWTQSGSAISLLNIPLDIGWNSINIPFSGYKAEDIGNEVNSQGGNLEKIERWHNGTWDGHIIGLPFNNFDIEQGKGYRLRCTTTSIWVVE